MVDRVYGWKPSLPDFRDFKYKVARVIELPDKVDLRSKDSPVENQGSLGSCTACAATSALEHNEIRDGLTFENLSRLFVYYNARTYDGNQRRDTGASNRDTVKALITFGACNELKWPYVISKFRYKPTAACYKDGLRHKAKAYYRLTRLNEIKACLAEGNVVIIGINLFSSFESDRTERTGMAVMPKESEEELGGHAIVVVGYIDKDHDIDPKQGDKSEHFICKNSWGNRWGEKGYFYLPYDYLLELGDDFWTIKK